MELSVYTLAIGDYSDCLERALESVKDADELVVLVGKDEKTNAIARKYTDKVFDDYKWCDDGAGARNHALSKCTGDWILELDCDNYLDGTIKQVQKIIDTTPHTVLSVTLQNGKNYHKLPILFRNDPTILYQGEVHEVLNTSAQDDSGLVIQERRSAKHTIDPDRNLRRLKNVLDKYPDRVREKFYYGRELYDNKQYFLAIEWLDKYLKVATWVPEIMEAYYYKAQALWHTSQGQLAREACLKAIQQNPDCKKALLLMSEMYFEPWKSKWKKIAERASNQDVIFV